MHRILYHMDADGHASGAIVAVRLEQRGVAESDIAFHPINYGMALPEIDYVRDYVYMVDFSLQPDDVMAEFAEKLGDRLVWIDHHDTSVEVEEKKRLEEVKGLRAVKWSDMPGYRGDDRKVAGCELTWKYYFEENIPQFITLIGDWDTWRWKDDPESKAPLMMMYLRSADFNPKRMFWWWRTNINMSLEQPEMIDSLLENDWLNTGAMLLGYQESQNKGLMYSKAFEAEFAGCRAVLVNQLGNSEMFKALYDPDKHDLMVTFQLIKGQYWSVSLYTTNPELHCGELAKKLGHAGPRPSGGGHAGAAGFQTDWDYLWGLIKLPE